MKDWAGFPFRAPLDPLRSYDDLSEREDSFVLKPPNHYDHTPIISGSNPTVYVSRGFSNVSITEQGTSSCYSEIILEGETTYTFFSPFLSDMDPVIFDHVRPGDVVSWCSPWAHSSSSSTTTYRVSNPSSPSYRSSFSDVSACSLRRPETLLLAKEESPSNDLDAFYSSSISDTENLLGSKTSNEIHFHHGIWSSTSRYVK